MISTKTILVILLIGTVAGMSTMAVSYSQAPNNANLSNVILSPPAQITVDVSVGNQIIATPTANLNNQSPFFQYSPGTYDISVDPPVGWSLVTGHCAVQQADGTFIQLGTFDDVDTINDVDLVAASAHICTWHFEAIETPQENIEQLIAQVEASIANLNQIRAEKAQLEAQLLFVLDQEDTEQAFIDELVAEINRLNDILNQS